MVDVLGRVPPLRPAFSERLAAASAPAVQQPERELKADHRRLRVAIIGGSHGGLACACSLIAAGTVSLSANP